jgi:NAD(P)-dependent dehydrogenase (short-subunit alcohol dehydrogenase family)
MRAIDRFLLDRRVALVVGADQDTGRAYAQTLAEAGADVAVVSGTLENAESIADEVLGQGRRSMAIQADIGKSSEVNRVIETILEKWGKLDIAVNNPHETWVLNAEDWMQSDQEVDITSCLTTTFLCTLAEAKVMLPHHGGTIINISSAPGLIGTNPFLHPGYSASQAAVIQMTRCLAAEWATLGVRVNALSPGLIRTTQGAFPNLDAIRKTLIESTPMARDGYVEELLGAILFLASDASSFMTGQNLVIDGGYTLL